MVNAANGNPSVDWKGTARYEVLACLGRGGMGVVYEAFDRERRQVVALKTLLDCDAAALYRFKQEFRTLAGVLHANLVHLYELVIPEEGRVFFTMELVRGTEFLGYVRAASHGSSRPPATEVRTVRVAALKGQDSGPAPEAMASERGTPVRTMLADEDRLRAALRQLAQGVTTLHAAGKSHRDIKPSNVLVTAEGRVVLLDFGVATELARPGRDMPTGGGSEIVGTAVYMAPEQADDAPPTAASDWYSVGVMLFEALVGRPPFTGSAIDVLTLKSSVDAMPPSSCVEGVPPDLDALCRALLHRDPAMRPTGEEILGRLGSRRSSAPPAAPGPGETGASFIGREKQLSALREAFEATRSGASVTVRVGGASGMGKSTVVHHFLDELVENGSAVVLRGRAYEREAGPYKAVDSVIDALSRHLLDLEPPLILPDTVWALARLFPVLKRIPSVEDAAEPTVSGPQAVRHMAFQTLRELFAALARRQPLVVFLDDVQWGDVDSASLLLEVLRGPSAPPLLVVMTFRDNEAQASPFLRELRDRWPEGARAVDVAVGPLEADDAMRLALQLLNESDGAARRVASAVARESRGSPFLIEELARSNRGTGSASGATLAVLTLDQIVSERLDRLPEPARLLIEIVAVGGRPLPVSVVGTAAGVEGSANETIAFLGARRFARTGQRDGRDVVETTHDRIRETIVGLLPNATLRDRHAALARALEEEPGGDAEAIALHWLGAGDAARAVRFAEDAAERSAKKLAFEHAARLIRIALEHTPPASEHAQELRARLAAALQEGGRYAESARAYIEAAAAAPADQRLRFRGAAAEQLLTAGRIDEGAEMLHGVLAAVDMRAPRSPIAAVFWLVVYRLWLLVLGLRVEERESSQVRDEDRMRVDVLFTASMGFAIINVVLGACMQARHLVEALRRGDRFQVLRAASIEASHLCAAGGRETARERALFAIGRRLAEREGTPAAEAYAHGARGIGLFLRGRFQQARQSCERSLAVPIYGNSAFSSTRLFAVYSMFFVGDFNECARRIAKLLAEAEERGDLYTRVNLATATVQHLGFVVDEPERGRRAAHEALALWSQNGFFLQHWQCVVYEAEVDMYVGDPRAGYERLKGAMPRITKSFLLHAAFVRAMTWHVLARAAIGSIPFCPGERDARIAEARRMSRRLEREADLWPKALAAQVRACAANAEGDRATAIAELRLSLARQAQSIDVYAWIVRHRLGLLLGGDEGRQLVRQAVEDMRAHGVRNPERWVSVYLPGEWGASAGAEAVPPVGAAGTKGARPSLASPPAWLAP